MNVKEDNIQVEFVYESLIYVTHQIDDTINSSAFVTKSVAIAWNNTLLFGPMSEPYIEHGLNNFPNAREESYGTQFLGVIFRYRKYLELCPIRWNEIALPKTIDDF